MTVRGSPAAPSTCGQKLIPSSPAEKTAALMNSVNPLYIARNHRVEQAIEQAVAGRVVEVDPHHHADVARLQIGQARSAQGRSGIEIAFHFAES